MRYVVTLFDKTDYQEHFVAKFKAKTDDDAIRIFGQEYVLKLRNQDKGQNYDLDLYRIGFLGLRTVIAGDYYQAGV